MARGRMRAFLDIYAQVADENRMNGQGCSNSVTILRGNLLCVLFLCSIPVRFGPNPEETLFDLTVKLQVFYVGGWLMTYSALVLGCMFILKNRKVIWQVAAFVACLMLAAFAAFQQEVNFGQGFLVQILFLGITAVCVAAIFGLENLSIRRISKVLTQLRWRWVEIYFLALFFKCNSPRCRKLADIIRTRCCDWCRLRKGADKHTGFDSLGYEFAHSNNFPFGSCH